jgi:hypothetical protein
MSDDLDQTTVAPPETYEPTVDAAPAAAVVLPRATTSGGRYRWAIAAGVVALVVVATALAIGLFTGRAANAVVLGYVPSDSMMYGEIRLDLPGDQRAAVGGFLSKFPGFADQSAMETKIDEVLDRLVGGATSGDQSYSSDLKPWFGGELAFSIGALPDPSTLSAPGPSAMQDVHFLVLVTINDEAAARAWFDSVIAESGATTSNESYGGASLTLITAEGRQQGAYGLLDGKVAVIGDVPSVKAAVDTKGTGSFGATAELKTALDSTSGDHVGFVYVALRPIVQWSSKLSPSEVLGLDSEVLTGLVPDWAAFALRVEGDALRMESLAPKAPIASTAQVEDSSVARHVPTTAVALSVSPAYGEGLLKTLDTYRADPGMKDTIATIDQALGFLGGPKAAVGWIGDLGIAVTRTEDGIEGGIVIVSTDPTAAGNFFTSLRTLASLGGSTVGVQVRDEAYAGTTITIVDLGNLAGLAGLAGVPSDMLGPTPATEANIELAYAVKDDVVVLGSGPGFVRHVLDTTAETSLASSQRYKDLAGRAGESIGTFVDLVAARELFETALAASEPADVAHYELEVKPFLLPFDALVGSSVVQGDVVRNTVIVTVK